MVHVTPRFVSNLKKHFQIVTFSHSRSIQNDFSVTCSKMISSTQVVLMCRTCHIHPSAFIWGTWFILLPRYLIQSVVLSSRLHKKLLGNLANGSNICVRVSLHYFLLKVQQEDLHVLAPVSSSSTFSESCCSVSLRNHYLQLPLWIFSLCQVMLWLTVCDRQIKSPSSWSYCKSSGESPLVFVEETLKSVSMNVSSEGTSSLT